MMSFRAALRREIPAQLVAKSGSRGFFGRCGVSHRPEAVSHRRARGTNGVLREHDSLSIHCQVMKRSKDEREI